MTGADGACIASFATAPFSVVIPIYNERESVEETVRELIATLEASSCLWEIVAVDDCSDDGTSERLSALSHPALCVVRHGRNRGYGAALKTGIKAARYPVIVITDADGTYPNHRIPELVAALDGKDMIVGARVGRGAKIPLVRRFPKWCIGKLANYLTRYRIPDLNSGLRVFSKEALTKYLNILPDGFSFTTTITLAMITRGHEVEYIPISYAPRRGRSKIRPIYDTLNFIQLIIRTVLLFEPLRVFLPVSLALLFCGAGAFVYSFFWLEKLLDATVVLCIVGALQILGIGMIADMVNRKLG